MTMSLSLLQYDPAWSEAFEAEAALLQQAYQPQPLELNHIGSTAIPGMLAKPIIDLLGVVTSHAVLDARPGLMPELGYEVMGAYGIEGRRYFRKSDEMGRRTHHLHIFERGSLHIERHLAFRDYLRAHPDRARDYSDVKRKLVGQGDVTGSDYVEGKAPFVLAVQAEALDWYRGQRC